MKLGRLARPPSLDSGESLRSPFGNESVTSADCAVGRAEPLFGSIWVSLPTLRSTYRHSSCLSHVGTEGKRVH
jgi:hypothetical protein